MGTSAEAAIVDYHLFLPPRRTNFCFPFPFAANKQNLAVSIPFAENKRKLPFSLCRIPET
jgi:hypothetical protein